VNDLRVQSRLWCGLILAALAVCVAGCQQQISFPTPKLLSISPNNAQAGQPALTVMVAGKGFTPSSYVIWRSAAYSSATLVSTYDAPTGNLIAQVPAVYLQSPGVAYIAVSTPQPGGGITPTQPVATCNCVFTVNPNPSAVPQITGFTPQSVVAGTAGLTLTVSGKDFVAQSTVMVNGSARGTAFVNSTTLRASLVAGDLANAGTLEITVYNPPPDGGASDTFGFNVNNPVPSLVTLTPTSALAGSAGVSLVVTGANFVPTSAILVNGAQKTTAFLGATQVTATLTAGDLTQGGVAQVQVVSPAPGGGSSNVLTFAINPTASAGLPDLVDYGYDGTQANNGICGTAAACAGGIPSLSTAGPSVSTSGQYVAFASNSTNLLYNQANAASAIFVRDTCLTGTATTGGTSSCFPHTVLVDLGVNGAVPNGPAEQPSMDSAGVHVAYTSTATNLVSYAVVDGSTRQVYWQPTCISASAGCAPTTTTGTAALVSMAPDGVTPGNGDSYDPVISPDGEYVAFVSLATNLVSGVTVDGVTPQVYVRNTCNEAIPTSGGCTPTTYLVSTPDGTTPGDGASSSPSIANQGLFVSYTSVARNLLGNASKPEFDGATSEVFERSTCITTIGTVGGTCVPSTKLISAKDQVTPADGPSMKSSVSQDGRYVAFASSAQNLIPGIGPTQQVYVSDTCEGVTITTPPTCTSSLNLVSTPDVGTQGGGTPATPTAANQPAEDPSINRCITSTAVTISCGTGQFIAFSSRATNLGPNVQNGVENVFVRNTCQAVSSTSACNQYTFLASQPAGAQASPANGDNILPALSGDGHVVSFLSSAGNLVASDTNGIPDAFIARAAPSVNLTVALQGSGSGTVKDSQSSLNCVSTTGTQTGTCSADYIYGTSVTLTATPASGYKFTGWGGSVTSTTCPSTVDSCTVTLVDANNITATFQ